MPYSECIGFCSRADTINTGSSAINWRVRFITGARQRSFGRGTSQRLRPDGGSGGFRRGRCGGTHYRAAFAGATNIGGVAIPQGSLAITTLQQVGTNWNLQLTAIQVNGQVMPVTSTFASTKGSSLGALAGMMNGGGSGLPWQKQPKSATPATTAAAPKVAASGARVYLPASTNVTFMVSAPQVQQAQNAPMQQPQMQQAQIQQAQIQQPQMTQVATPITMPAPTANVTPISMPATPVAGNTPMGQAGQLAQMAQTGQSTQSTQMTQQMPMQQPQMLQQPAQQPSAGNSNIVVFGNVEYQLSGCHREAPHIVCELLVMNLGSVDAKLMGDGRTYFIDQSGNRGAIKSATVANCNLGVCDLLPQLPMKARYIFTDDTGESRTLVRLQIWAGGAAVAQFSNIPVQ